MGQHSFELKLAVEQNSQILSRCNIFVSYRIREVLMEIDFFPAFSGLQKLLHS